MESQLELWIEIVQEADSLTDPLFLECLESGNMSDLFAHIKDDNLKSILSLTNKLLNDPKSRSRGMTVLGKLLIHVNTSRFIAFQDSLVSAFHMIVKDIDSIGTLNVLSKIIPSCKHLSVVNQTITSTVIPKILSYICNDCADSEPSSEELELLKVCLEKYHGPCGNYRLQLEKKLLNLIDNPSVNIRDVVPLLSSAGGGGTKGDKHGRDWYEMVIKICCSAYDSLISLYSDACPVLEDQNPFDGQTCKLNVPEIKEQKVFVRISLLKSRIINLCGLLGTYLRNPFSAPKPVPVKSILRLISNMLLLNPVDLVKKSQFSTPKEFYFLASVLPSIHECSFKLLRNLMISVGTNMLPDASTVEQFIIQEFKWMSTEHQSFENLKIEIYRALIIWMKVTKNTITTSKCVNVIVEFIERDIQIEKETVKLNAAAVTGKSKHHKNRKSGSDFALSSILSSDNVKYTAKSPEVTSLALELMTKLISCLDSSKFVKIHQMISKTVIFMTQSSSLPSSYSSAKCRSSLYNCILALAINPHPQSSSSLSLLTNLARRGVDDPISSVSTNSHQILSTLERLIHPICPSMDFVNVALPAATSTMETTIVETNGIETQEALTEMFETSCQTDIASPPHTTQSSFHTETSFSTPIGTFNSVELKKLIAEAIRENIGDASTPQPQTQNSINAREANNINTRPLSFTPSSQEPFTPSSTPLKSSTPLISTQANDKPKVNGSNKAEEKRKWNDEVHSDTEEQQLTTKRQKITTEDSAEVEEMLLSFVDIGCNEN